MIACIFLILVTLGLVLFFLFEPDDYRWRQLYMADSKKKGNSNTPPKGGAPSKTTCPTGQTLKNGTCVCPDGSLPKNNKCPPPKSVNRRDVVSIGSGNNPWGQAVGAGACLIKDQDFDGVKCVPKKSATTPATTPATGAGADVPPKVPKNKKDCDKVNGTWSNKTCTGTGSGTGAGTGAGVGAGTACPAGQMPLMVGGKTVCTCPPGWTMTNGVCGTGDDVPPKVPKNKKDCDKVNGTWSNKTCTVPGGAGTAEKDCKKPFTWDKKNMSCSSSGLIDLSNPDMCGIAGGIPTGNPKDPCRLPKGSPWGPSLDDGKPPPPPPISPPVPPPPISPPVPPPNPCKFKGQEVDPATGNCRCPGNQRVDVQVGACGDPTTKPPTPPPWEGSINELVRPVKYLPNETLIAPPYSDTFMTNYLAGLKNTPTPRRR